MGNSTVYVTPEGLKKLEDELEHLRTVKRQGSSPARGSPPSTAEATT